MGDPYSFHSERKNDFFAVRRCYEENPDSILTAYAIEEYNKKYMNEDEEKDENC